MRVQPAGQPQLGVAGGTIGAPSPLPQYPATAPLGKSLYVGEATVPVEGFPPLDPLLPVPPL